MNGSGSGKWSAGLPYVNNFRIVLMTAAINIAIVFAFFWGRPLTYERIAVDACICGITTSFIDVFIVFAKVRRLRAQGHLPTSVPESRLMAALPRNPLLLALVFGAVFGLLSPLFNALVIRFYEVETNVFVRFAVWRIAYACVLSAKIVELAILRYVQSDCMTASDAVQEGTEQVKDPLPRLSTVRQWYNTVADDFGFNLLFGLVVGGTIVKDHMVIILPTTRGGVAIAATILGMIITARMVYPVARNMRNARDSGNLPVSPVHDRRVSWLPDSPARFALVLLLPVTAMTLLSVWAIFTIFGFEALNFFQYFFIRTLLVTLLTRPVVSLAIGRYTQPSTKSKAREEST